MLKFGEQFAPRCQAGLTALWCLKLELLEYFELDSLPTRVARKWSDVTSWRQVESVGSTEGFIQSTLQLGIRVRGFRALELVTGRLG